MGYGYGRMRELGLRISGSGFKSPIGAIWENKRRGMRGDI